MITQEAPYITIVKLQIIAVCKSDKERLFMGCLHETVCNKASIIPFGVLYFVLYTKVHLTLHPKVFDYRYSSFELYRSAMIAPYGLW